MHFLAKYDHSTDALFWLQTAFDATKIAKLLADSYCWFMKLETVFCL